MADTKTKADEEPKATLPPGHPQAGYVDPDLSTHEGTGTIPDEEKAWHEARNEARDEQKQAVEEGEDKAVKEEQKKQEEQAKIAQERAEHLEKEKYGPTAGKLPGDASYQEPSSESSSSSTKASSTTKS